MTGLSMKTDFYQLFEKDLLSGPETINISFRVSIWIKKTRITGRKRADKSHLDPQPNQYDWNHMTKYDIIILLVKQKIYECIY